MTELNSENDGSGKTILRNGEKVGTVQCQFLELQIDGLTIHNTSIEPHGKYEYEVKDE